MRRAEQIVASAGGMESAAARSYAGDTLAPLTPCSSGSIGLRLKAAMDQELLAKAEGQER